MFLQQAVTDSGIPFKIRKYNQETMDAYNEVEDMINNPDKYKGYDNLDDLWKDLGI
jgi:antitoxin component of RelBE/YafQ-DinJ toxin-antitoxin module